MRLEIKIDGDLNKLMSAEILAGARAVTTTMRGAGSSLKTNWRGQIVGAGLGQRLSNSIRSNLYPTGRPSMNAAALVFSKAPKIILAHETGPLIRSPNGWWLAIPTQSAGKSRRGGRISPLEWEKRTGRRLRFVFRPGKAGLLVDDGTLRAGNAPAFGQRKPRGFRNRTVVIFTLVPQVKLRKRLNLLAAADAVHGSIPAAIVANWRVTR